MSTESPKESGSNPPFAPSDRTDAAWVELAMEAADMGAMAWDLESDRFYISPRAAKILNATPGVVKADKGVRLTSYTHPDDLDRVRDTIANAVKTGEPYKMEHRSFRVNDPGVIWVLSAGTPVKNKAGKVVRLLGVLQDITERKEQEAQRDTLVAELDHRVKNVLASVQSMALQSARKSPSLDAFMRTFAGRLKAMASAHTLLTTTRWRGAEMQHIVAAELGGIAPSQTRWEGPAITLTPRATNAVALALHELATNAVKFGALSSEAGRVDIRWRNGEDGGFVLDWAETGGPAPGPPGRQGFGSTLLSRVTGREIGGEVKLEFGPPGVRARMTSGPAAIAAAPVGAPAESPPPEDVADHAATAPPENAPQGVEGMRILIVEDSLLLSLELEHGLVEAGAIIAGQAAEVSEALELISKDIDGAILDADLNGESAGPVADALNKASIPFVVATGYGQKQAAPLGMEAPFIRKPYDLGQVTAALASIRRSP